jgi:hypothetical protein
MVYETMRMIVFCKNETNNWTALRSQSQRSNHVGTVLKSLGDFPLRPLSDNLEIRCDDFNEQSKAINLD